MPGSNITIDSLLAVLLALLVLASIVLTVVLQRKSRQVKTLEQRVDDLNGELEALRRPEAPADSLREAYLQFIYNLSHEVSNPLQSVQANLENMADCSPEEIGRWNQYYVVIRQEMKRLAALTQNLRLLSHLESSNHTVRRAPVNLKSVIEDVIMAQVERAEAKHINLNYEGPNRPARVLGDRDLLNQAIHNLVDNSIKYAKESGGEIAIALRDDTRFMHIQVRDTGLGISPEDLPFIFDTAYRSSNKLTVHRSGSGLGLAIVKRIVNQHEGAISTESVLGQGTTMTIDLPLYSPEVSRGNP
jgi:two-component system, OmpR family, phosphate regulon sensor histidine kinase PhoR